MPPAVDDEGDRCTPLDNVKCFCTYLFSLFFFFLRSAAQTSLRPSWGRFDGERLRISLHDAAHKSLLQSGKGRSDLANDCSTFLDEVWNRPPHSHTPCRRSLQPVVHLAQPLLDFLSAMQEQGIVVRVARAAKPGSHSSGRNSWVLRSVFTRDFFVSPSTTQNGQIFNSARSVLCVCKSLQRRNCMAAANHLERVAGR